MIVRERESMIVRERDYDSERESMIVWERS